MPEPDNLHNWFRSFEREDVGTATVLHIETADGTITLGRDWLDSGDLHSEWEAALSELLTSGTLESFPHEVHSSTAVSGLIENGLIPKSGESNEHAWALLALLQSEDLIQLDGKNVIVPNLPQNAEDWTVQDYRSAAVYCEVASEHIQKHKITYQCLIEGVYLGQQEATDTETVYVENIKRPPSQLLNLSNHVREAIQMKFIGPKGDKINSVKDAIKYVEEYNVERTPEESGEETTNESEKDTGEETTNESEKDTGEETTNESEKDNQNDESDKEKFSLNIDSLTFDIDILHGNKKDFESTGVRLREESFKSKYNLDDFPLIRNTIPTEDIISLEDDREHAAEYSDKKSSSEDTDTHITETEFDPEDTDT